MSRPTLRELASLPAAPARLADSTLVLIDCQNTYTQGIMELDGVQAALEQTAQLLDRARSAGIPIIHIQHSDGPGSLYDIDGESVRSSHRWRRARENRWWSSSSPIRSYRPISMIG